MAIELTTGRFSADMAAFQKELEGFAKDEIPFATAYVLTQMGKAGKLAAMREIELIFDRPKKFTINSIFLTAARKGDFPNQKATVWIKDKSLHSLKHHVTGGQRSAKTSEKMLRNRGILKGSHQYVVPGSKAPRDKYGNMTTSQITKVLSAVGAWQDAGYSANSTTDSIKKNSGQGNYFVMKATPGHPAGIYKRVGKGDNSRLDAIMIFMRKTIYGSTFAFHGVVTDTAYDAMPAATSKALDQAITRSFKK